ncbi:MAG TPA: phosphate regulon sensor histidine kinase PhoR [Usitatibacter sp.]|nr:phosphate regulon sensor histidine kinase PhoR [Usitatibacter sp.]
MPAQWILGGAALLLAAAFVGAMILLRAGRAREKELRDAVEGWRAAARALPDGVTILEGHRLVWCNDVAHQHLDLDPGHAVGRPLTHLLRIPAFSDYLAAADFSRPVLVEMPLAAGRVLSLQVIPYGESQRLLLSRDVTQLQQVERMRREFVANVSHELRTPLTVVSGFVETLREENDPSAARGYLDLMAAQADRMRRLVEDLLTLSALESAPAPGTERVQMATMVERLAAEARVLSNGRHEIRVESSAAFDLLGSDKELSSAFGNLVSNAVRYTPEGGRVCLRWVADGEGASFQVSDTGIGIPSEHISRLTERFYRVDRGRSRETGGTGLGLAIVKHALNRHGATLQVASQPGQGSTFTARFHGARLHPHGKPSTVEEEERK